MLQEEYNDNDHEKMERIEYENYSLRRRCKRLEGIVSHLLQTKKEVL